MIDNQTHKMLCRATCHLVLTLKVVNDGGCDGLVIKGLKTIVDPYSKNDERTFCFASVYTWVGFAVFEV